ncbi:3-hydroxyisobutyryl-CoA hydrolase-like protein 2, mitochondrial, partial [Mucuna pruriens]
MVAILDRITMGCGSGSGISLPGMFRVVTDKTIFSHPEAQTGYLGEYLAGDKLNGVEMIACHLATHYSLNARLALLEEHLSKLITDEPCCCIGKVDESYQVKCITVIPLSHIHSAMKRNFNPWYVYSYLKIYITIIYNSCKYQKNPGFSLRAKNNSTKMKLQDPKRTAIETDPGSEERKLQGPKQTVEKIDSRSDCNRLGIYKAQNGQSKRPIRGPTIIYDLQTY